MLKSIVLSLIKAYQRISPTINSFGQNLGVAKTDCKFQPTCSNYATEAIKKYGILKGSYLGIKRILRCHPFAKGGYDPVK